MLWRKWREEDILVISEITKGQKISKKGRERKRAPPTFDQDLKGIEWKNYFMRKIIFFMKDSLLKLSQNKITK